MKIILSPTKQMKYDPDTLAPKGNPVFLKRTDEILRYLRSKSYEELKALWKCNDKIAKDNFERIGSMELDANLTPAVLSYDGIAFQYMAPSVFEDAQFEYIEEHLRILSGFYGVLKPMDGVVPYRLEMQAKAKISGFKDLYDFWGRNLYDEVTDDDRTIINLASKEYSLCIEKYLQKEDRYITIDFVEESGGKLATKGTYAKMARGEMVRYMAEMNIEEPEGIKSFNRLHYVYRDDLSSETKYVFQRIPPEKNEE